MTIQNTANITNYKTDIGNDRPSEHFAYLEELTNNLGTLFAERAVLSGDHCEFVTQNYAEMKEAKLFSMAIPAELGGGGLSYSELCSICRQLSQHCGSTALAFSMHSHPVALNVFKHRRGDEKATATLKKIAENELVIAGTGANDWLSSNGTCTPVPGGYCVNAHKRFVSGSVGAQVLVTSVNFEHDDGKREVLHFSIPISSEGIKKQNNWRTIGMRGTGSNDVILENVFVPEAAVTARRPAGEWHAIWNTILPIAMPLISSVYLGLAEKAARIAIDSANNRTDCTSLLGQMKNQLVIAQLAVVSMVSLNDDLQFTPSMDIADAILSRKTIATNAITQTVELASMIVGGSSFFQSHPLEIVIRDVRAMHFHPLPAHKQTELSGRILAGLNPIH